jgi:hypothetical protein
LAWLWPHAVYLSGGRVISYSLSSVSVLFYYQGIKMPWVQSPTLKNIQTLQNYLYLKEEGWESGSSGRAPA